MFNRWIFFMMAANGKRNGEVDPLLRKLCKLSLEDLSVGGTVVQLSRQVHIMYSGLRSTQPNLNYCRLNLVTRWLISKVWKHSRILQLFPAVHRKEKLPTMSMFNICTIWCQMILDQDKVQNLLQGYNRLTTFIHYGPSRRNPLHAVARM